MRWRAQEAVPQPVSLPFQAPSQSTACHFIEFIRPPTSELPSTPASPSHFVSGPLADRLANETVRTRAESTPFTSLPPPFSRSSLTSGLTHATASSGPPGKIHQLQPTCLPPRPLLPAKWTEVTVRWKSGRWTPRLRTSPECLIAPKTQLTSFRGLLRPEVSGPVTALTAVLHPLLCPGGPPGLCAGAQRHQERGHIGASAPVLSSCKALSSARLADSSPPPALCTKVISQETFLDPQALPPHRPCSEGLLLLELSFLF